MKCVMGESSNVQRRPLGEVQNIRSSPGKAERRSKRSFNDAFEEVACVEAKKPKYTRSSQQDWGFIWEDDVPESLPCDENISKQLQGHCMRRDSLGAAIICHIPGKAVRKFKEQIKSHKEITTDQVRALLDVTILGDDEDMVPIDLSGAGSSFLDLPEPEDLYDCLEKLGAQDMVKSLLDALEHFKSRHSPQKLSDMTHTVAHYRAAFGQD